MIKNLRLKQISIALCVAALGVFVASCGAESTNPLSPAPAGAPSSAALSAGVITQLVPFFYPDGTEVVSANGEPDDAVLNRFDGQPKQRINWQLMTQYLTPGVVYDIWLEGSNNGTDSFSWWVGAAKANAGGDLNVTGTVYAGAQPGPGVGVFTNPLAEANLVIKTTSGVVVQIAHFPAP